MNLREKANMIADAESWRSFRTRMIHIDESMATGIARDKEVWKAYYDACQTNKETFTAAMQIGRYLS